MANPEDVPLPVVFCIDGIGRRVYRTTCVVGIGVVVKGRISLAVSFTVLIG